MPAVPLADVVVLEPLPQHREVVDLLELADVEPPDALGDRRLLEVVDDFRLSGGRPPVQDHDLERLSPHAPPRRSRAGAAARPFPSTRRARARFPSRTLSMLPARSPSRPSR